MSRNELNLEQNCKYCAARGKSDAEHTNCRLMSLICDRWYGSILTRYCGLTMTGLLKRASSKGAYPMFEAQNKGPCCYIDGSPRKTGGSRAHRAQIAARSQFEVMQKVRVSSIYQAKLISILQNLRRYGYVNISVHDRYSVLLHSYAFVLSKPGKSHFPDQIFPPPFGQGRGQTLRTVVLVSSTFFPSFCGSSKTMTKVIRNLDVQGRGLQTCMALYGSMAVRCSKHTIKSLGQRDASGLLPLFTT